MVGRHLSVEKYCRTCSWGLLNGNLPCPGLTADDALVGRSPRPLRDWLLCHHQFVVV